MKKQIIIAILAVALASACTKKTDESKTESTTTTTTQTTSNASGAQTGEGASGMKVDVQDITAGKGAEAVSGKTVTVNYVGTLKDKDKTKFDSSYDRKEPFSFMLGAGQVIKGWEQGILGMKVGGKRKLTIPPELAYGDNAVGAIPAKSTLVFEVELLDVK